MVRPIKIAWINLVHAVKLTLNSPTTFALKNPKVREKIAKFSEQTFTCPGPQILKSNTAVMVEVTCR